MRSTHARAPKLCLSDHDRQRLRRILRRLPPARKAGPLRDLENQLNSAPDARIALVQPDVNTLNSRFCIRDMRSGRSRTYTLEIPMLSEKPPNPERLSVLDPVGAACMGRHDGDVIECETRAGLTRFTVERILAQKKVKQ